MLGVLDGAARRCWAPSLPLHHELFQRLVSLVAAEQEDFFDFILLEAHVVELS